MLPRPSPRRRTRTPRPRLGGGASATPSAAFTGSWKSKPSADVAIDLTLKEEGAFTRVVDTKGRKQTLEGTAGFNHGTLALLQADGPPLVGKVAQTDANTFEFRPPNAPSNAPGLKFSR